MNQAELVRKLRDLRRLERRWRPGRADLCWNRYFTLSRMPGSASSDSRVYQRPRTPSSLLAMPSVARKELFERYVTEIASLRLKELGMLPGEFELDTRGSSAARRKALREALKRHHPDVGGDSDTARRLIDEYRRLAF